MLHFLTLYRENPSFDPKIGQIDPSNGRNVKKC